MIAEITFSCTSNLPRGYVQRLNERIKANCRLDEAIAETVWSEEDPKPTDRFQHWQKTELYVFLMSEDSVKSFKVHVESIYQKADLGSLKRHVREIVECFKKT